MQIRSTAILAGFFLLIYLSAEAVTGKYPIKNFLPDEYKAGIQNIDFAQNRDMNLFVANNLGVLSFNGNEWTVYAYNTGKKQRSLAFDEHLNRLYVGSQSDFGFFVHHWNYVSLVDLIPEDAPDFDEVWDVFIKDDKNVYFCTFQGIYVYDGQSINVIQNDGGFDRSFLTGNRLFSQSPAGELFEIEGIQISNAITQKRKNQIVAGVIARNEGYLIFYNSGQIEYSNNLNVNDVFPQLARTLEGKYVNHILELSDTRLIIATQRAGLFLFDEQSGHIENISTKDGLQTNACLRTYQDFTGNLWIGMQNGIALIDINSPMKIIDDNINLEGSGYEVFEAIEGTYYTTSNGIFYQPKNSGATVFIDGTEGPAYGMQQINGKLYVGHHTGLFLLKNGVAKRCAYTNGLWGVKKLIANPGYAIGGTYSGLHLFRINDLDELEGVQKIQGFNESSRFFEEDRKGRIWVGQYYRGLYQLQLNESLTKLTILKNPESINLDIGRHVILSKLDGELYLGTELGIYKVDQTSDIISRDDLFSGVIGRDWVYLLAQDYQKNVYVFTSSLLGFFKQVSAKNYVYVPSSLFQLRQTFNNDLLTVSTNVGSGVFFNANEGFIHYNPQLEERLVIERRPLISKIYSLAQDKTLYAQLPFESRPEVIEPIKITQGTRVLKFLVESYNYKDVNNRQFRYYLKGFDEDYGDWSDVTFKEYTNLIEGEYEFFVQTSNYLGEAVTGIPVRIIVVPPFYKSITAKFIYAILIALLLYLAYRIQRQYYKGKQLRVELLRQEELAEKQKELKKLKDEKTESELSNLNNLLAASTMNLVVKNEFMENIKEEIKQVKMNKRVEDAQKALERIIKEIETTLKVQEDWKQFEYHFDRVHGDFLTRLTNEFLDLTPGEQKLCAFLRLKMDTKEIANLLGITLRGVEVARYRLRKKLGLSKEDNLSKFILEY